MSRQKRLIFFLVLAVIYVVAPVWADKSTFRQPKNADSGPLISKFAPQMNHFNTRELKTLAGEIESIEVKAGGTTVSNRIVEISVRGKSKKVCKAELAPYWYIYSKKFNLAKGDKVKICGFLKKDGENYRMLVTEIISGKEILELRSDVGVPLWGTRRLIDVGIDKKGQRGSHKEGGPDVQGRVSTEQHKERPSDFGPSELWKEKEVVEKLNWFVKTFNILVNKVGGPATALFILFLLLVVVMLRTFRTKSTWEKVKYKHEHKQEWF